MSKELNELRKFKKRNAFNGFRIMKCKIIRFYTMAKFTLTIMLFYCICMQGCSQEDSFESPFPSKLCTNR